jgi:iron(III) transport system substrate-binding protein
MRNRSSIPLLITVPAGIGLLILSGCGANAGTDAPSDADEAVASGDWEAIVAQAEAEGVVTYYSSQNQPNVEALEKAFEAEYPRIDLQFVRGLPQDLVPRLEIDFASGQGEADVYTTADAEWPPAAFADGNIAEVVGPRFSSEGFDADSLLFDDAYFVSNAATNGIGWNSDLYPKGLDTAQDLLDPALAGGRIGVPEASNTALTDFYVFLEEVEGPEFVDALAAQEPRIYPGGVAIVEALSSGEIAATIYAQPVIEASIEAGAPLDWTMTDDAWGALFYSQVLSSAPHPAAAQVLADFMLSDPGQEALAEGAVAAMPGIENSLADIHTLRVQDPSTLTPEFVAEYQERWRGLFQ